MTQHDIVTSEGFTEEFFAPAATDLLDGLIAQYRSVRKTIAHTAGLFAGDMGNVVHYFMRGNGCDQRGYSSLIAERLFQEKGAVAALNAAYWSKALALTDVLDMMPQKRRDEWNEQITKMTTPEFTEDAVRPTLADLLASRAKFLAERVDGIFRGLSGEHVTNSPAAFGKRMILARVVDQHGSVDYSTSGLINDLRCVVARFMGRDEPGRRASSDLIRRLIAARTFGAWVSLDGGALRIRIYHKGTAHLEVHPDMSWRLNSILASLYPLAIPPEFRQKPKRQVKQVDLIQRPLPFAVLSILESMKPATQMVESGYRKHYRNIQNTLAFGYLAGSSNALDEAARVLASIGAVKTAKGWFQFDYPPDSVITEIVASGCVPDARAHQFFPTPESVALDAIAMADIGPTDLCLEPSAGLGGMADHMPRGRTVCVEVSPLHCKVLIAKGHQVFEADFLAWRGGLYDRIVMNPPFSDGRWQAHLAHAATLLAPGGRLVAVLPASANGKDVLPGRSLTWSRTYSNEFAGTSVSVVLLVAQ